MWNCKILYAVSTGAYTTVINEINALIDQYNTLLAARKPGDKDDKDEEGETPTE